MTLFSVASNWWEKRKIQICLLSTNVLSWSCYAMIHFDFKINVLYNYVTRLKIKTKKWTTNKQHTFKGSFSKCVWSTIFLMSLTIFCNNSDGLLFPGIAKGFTEICNTCSASVNRFMSSCVFWTWSRQEHAVSRCVCISSCTCSISCIFLRTNRMQII